MVQGNKFIGHNLQRIMAKKKIAAKELAAIVGVSPTHLSYVMNNKRGASQALLESLAKALGVSVDRLIGESASSIIENKLDELNMTYEDLEKISGVPAGWLKNLDSWIPGISGYGEEVDSFEYQWITQVAHALKIPGSFLRAAFARQEIPVYDGQMPSAQEVFNDNYVKEAAVYKLDNLIPVNDRIIKLPLLGKIPAGIPLECEENIIGYIDTPESEIKNGEYFYLIVQGDSMVGSGIMDGYTVLVRKQPTVENGEIAVVRVNKQEATLKRVKKINGQTILYPDNPKYEPIVINSDEAEIIGKVVKVIFDPNKKRGVL